MKVKSESEAAQSCPTLSNLVDCSLLGSSIHGISQARVLKWGAIAFSVFHTYLPLKRASLVAQMVKNLPEMLETSILAWRIPWTEEPHGL